MKFSGWLRLSGLGCLLVLLMACGGGEGSSSSSNGDGLPNTLPASPNERIQLALSTADASVIQPGDADTVMTRALTSYQSTLDQLAPLLKSFYDGLSTEYELVRESYLIQPSVFAMDKTYPLVIGDLGNVLASFGTMGGGRIAGYGYDILAGVKIQNGSRPAQLVHQAVLKRVLAWLVSGDPLTDWTHLSAQQVNIAWSSLPRPNTSGSLPYAEQGMRALSLPFTSLTCDPLALPVKDCAAKAQLVVMGAVDRRLGVDLPLQLTRLKEIIAAKIPVLYLNAHPDGGGPNDAATLSVSADYPRMKALGFAFGELPVKRNYYIQDKVAVKLSVEQLAQRADKIGPLLLRMKEHSYSASYDWSKCVNDACVKPTGFVTEIDNPVNEIMGKLDESNTNGQSFLDTPGQDSLTMKLLVYWSDAYRRTIQYPIDKVRNPGEFQAAYIADSWVSYVRKKGTPQSKLGTFLGDKAPLAPVSSSAEVIEVTLPGRNGMTSIGRFAVPGKPIEVQWLTPPPQGTFQLQINTMEPGTNKKWEPTQDSNGKDQPSSGLRRPMYLRSPSFPLGTEPLTVTSPYGGTLQLQFNGASTASVKLQIKGAGSHPFYDTTQGTPNAQLFFDAVKTTTLGWMEIKTPGLEIHALISKMMEMLEPPASENDVARAKYPNTAKPYYSLKEGVLMSTYLDEAKKYVMEDAYQMTGFITRGLDLSEGVKQFCTQNNWDCTDPTIHVPPVVQHYHHDFRSNCGSMCSGNPIHSSSGFEPRGWGESHEIGHNLQRFKVYDGMSIEVSNNIFPMHKKWRMFRDLGRTAVGYYNELGDTQIVFDLLKTAQSETNKTAAVRQRLWTNPAYAAQNRARLYFYMQWVFIYYETLRESGLTESKAWDQAWDVFPLLYLQLRQIESTPAASWTTGTGIKWGFSQYANKPWTSDGPDTSVSPAVFPHHDYLLVALGKITGKDLRGLFDLWGVETTSQGRNQVAALNLKPQANWFYATVCSDDFRAYVRIDMNDSQAKFPSAWGSTPFLTLTANKLACEKATADYLAAQPQ